MKTKCNLCDERGYIVDKSVLPNHSAHSCECGWAIDQSKQAFDKMFEDSNDKLEKLMSYAHQRIQQKSK